MNYRPFYNLMESGYKQAEARKLIEALSRCETRGQIKELEINNIFLIDEMDLYQSVKDAYHRVDAVNRERKIQLQTL